MCSGSLDRANHPTTPALLHTQLVASFRLHCVCINILIRLPVAHTHSHAFRSRVSFCGTERRSTPQKVSVLGDFFNYFAERSVTSHIIQTHPRMFVVLFYIIDDNILSINPSSLIHPTGAQQKPYLNCYHLFSCLHPHVTPTQNAHNPPPPPVPPVLVARSSSVCATQGRNASQRVDIQSGDAHSGRRAREKGKSRARTFCVVPFRINVLGLLYSCFVIRYTVQARAQDVIASNE